MGCGVGTGISKYRYWISFNAGGSWVELFLNIEAKVTYKRPEKRIYYRAESTSWKITKFLNVTGYTTIIAYLASFYTCPELKLKITDNSGDYWLGRTAVNMIDHNLDTGVLMIKSTHMVQTQEPSPGRDHHDTR